MMAYTGRPESGTFFRLQVYKGVGILLVEVYERVGKSVIWGQWKDPKDNNQNDLLIVCQLRRDVIGYEDAKCHWCVSIRLLLQFNSR